MVGPVPCGMRTLPGIRKNCTKSISSEEECSRVQGAVQRWGYRLEESIINHFPLTINGVQGAGLKTFQSTPVAYLEECSVAVKQSIRNIKY